MSPAAHLTVASVAAVGGIWALPAVAQMSLTEACEAASASGVEFRQCAIDAYDEADAELNEVYRLAITRAKAFDVDAAVEGQAGPLTLEEALRRAQRDWIVFRESDCDALAVTFGGGTGAMAAGTLCRAEKTLARAQALRSMMADY
ncbi:Uncharacterized conserved protein YecT, DUF1311 family [Jannaschia faecimaris]|uniref:Uncharacterized conserved protein YecT, DUF1311 family n=1 Tax=Jannaschia faecimaris TaxID=1244108 RepID=A0A1H3S1F9_9RHOB|nr:lysozyme inhibitor LprI family protein [Jannaschia faecimaris]SDZ31714.1 Uncharacterized conserved protein YecT, DUF1311 family [Jannaschia faecimaris]